jgi:hypothetical protein
MPETGDTCTQPFGPRRSLLMGWVRISDDFYDHEKFIGVTALGIATWVAGLAHSNRNLTDGFISRRAARGLIGLDHLAVNTSNFSGRDAEPDDGITELVTAGIWHARGHDCPDCPDLASDLEFYIHDFLKYQPSRAEVEEKRAQVRARVTKHRNAHRNDVTDTVTNADGNGGVTPPPNPNPKDPSKTSKSQSSPIGGAGGDGTDGLTPRAAQFRVDGHRVRTELTKVLGEFPDDDTVMRVTTGYLARASEPPKDPTAYVVGAIRKSEFEAQKLAHGEAS